MKLPYPTPTRTAFAREVHEQRIRWYRHETPVAYHAVTGRKHTADLDELVKAGLARIPPCDPGLSAVAELTPEGIVHFGLGEGPGSTSPEPGFPRFEPDAELIVNAHNGEEEWTGAEWNEYVAAAERGQNMVTARLVRCPPHITRAELEARYPSTSPEPGRPPKPPVIHQDPGTGLYLWRCWCGATWAEDPAAADADPILDAEGTARQHWLSHPRTGSEQPGWIDEAAGHSTEDGAPRG